MAVQTQAKLKIMHFPCSQILIFLIGMYLNLSNVIQVLQINLWIRNNILEQVSFSFIAEFIIKWSKDH